MKLKQHSLGFKLWMYFLLFSAIILCILWLLQIVFLNSFYQDMKQNEMTRMADEITSSYGDEDFKDTIDRLAVHNSALVFLTDTDGNIIYMSDEHSRGENKFDFDFGKNSEILFRPLPEDYNEFLYLLNKSEDGNITYTTHSELLNKNTLVHGEIVGDVVLYLSTQLEPVEGTVEILKRLLIYVTILVLIIGFFISYFIAKRLSRPISNITNSAQELAKGNYEVQFVSKEYEEVDKLASMLNHTAKELSKVEKLRRELISNISHDLRTPLTMIKAYAEMIRDISGDKKEKRDAHLKVIVDETDRLTGLVNDILELSVIQTEEEPMEIKNVDFSDIVNKMLLRFEAIQEKDGYIFNVHVTPDQYTYADRSKMERVVYNLIGNAVNYVGDDKTVSINVIDKGSVVRFEVIDSGKGIPEEELDLIWERYYKAKTHKRSVVSNGIGLSIVKNILERHQATFGIESEVGKGSNFWFELKK